MDTIVDISEINSLRYIKSSFQNFYVVYNRFQLHNFSVSNLDLFIVNAQFFKNKEHLLNTKR